MAWQCISPEMTVKGSRKCCVSDTVNGTDGVMLWNGTAESGVLGVSVRKMKALTVKVETVILTDKAR